MSIKREFVPVSLLMSALENQEKLYFLYREAAETGSRGAILRFEKFRETLSLDELSFYESRCASRPQRRRSA